MTAMTAYDIEIIYNDKSVAIDKSGPYYGSYLDIVDAEARADDLRLLPDVFLVRLMHGQVMG